MPSFASPGRWLDFKPSYEEDERIRRLAMQERLRGAGSRTIDRPESGGGPRRSFAR